MKVLYQTQATAIGGRAGCAASADRRLRVDLSEPLALGGDDGLGTNPEQLLALGYAASLLSAIRHIAARDEVTLTPCSNVTAKVGIGHNDNGHGLALEVSLAVDMPDVDEATANRLVAEAVQRCPFCNAMRGEVDVRLSVD
jgi:Ohr subfamily peroxiredoxin